MNDILCDVDGPVAVLTVNRPGRPNGVTAEMTAALQARLS